MALSAQKSLPEQVEADLLAQATTAEQALAAAVAARDAAEETLGIRRGGEYTPGSAGASAAQRTLFMKQAEIAHLVAELYSIENGLGYSGITAAIVPTERG